MARIEPVEFLDLHGRAILIRNCQAGDGAGSIDFMRTIARETSFTNNPPDRGFRSPDEIDKSWVEALDDPHRAHVGAFCDGSMIGQLVCFRIDPGHPYVGHVARFGMMVLREFWGSGAARALIGSMDRYVVAQGILRVEAMVRASNARGRHFYAKLGFIEEGTRHRAARIDGAWVDDIYIGRLYA